MTYKSHIAYKFLALVWAAFSLLIGETIFSTIVAQQSWYGTFLDGNMQLDGLFFLLVCLGGVVWGIHMAWSKVSLTEGAINVHAPLTALRSVELRQLISASEDGRARLLPGQAITLLYHPLDKNGLVDLDDVRSLYLPVVADQAQLLESLQAAIPQ